MANADINEFHRLLVTLRLKELECGLYADKLPDAEAETKVQAANDAAEAVLSFVRTLLDSRASERPDLVELKRLCDMTESFVKDHNRSAGTGGITLARTVCVPTSTVRGLIAEVEYTQGLNRNQARTIGEMEEEIARLQSSTTAQAEKAQEIGFSEEELREMLSICEAESQSVNVGNVTGECDTEIESTHGFFSRLLRDVLAGKRLIPAPASLPISEGVHAAIEDAIKLLEREAANGYQLQERDEQWRTGMDAVVLAARIVECQDHARVLRRLIHATASSAERREGKTKLVYNKETRTIDTVSTPASAEQKCVRHGCMDNNEPQGTQVRFSHPNNGYPQHQDTAAKHLIEGALYTVESTDEGNWHTDVYLREAPGTPFNSVMFCNPKTCRACHEGATP